MGRAPCCEKMGLKKGPWTKEEDHILIDYINQYGHGNWRALPKQAGLLRCGKSCRLRWTNYLRPGIKRGNFSKEEEDTILKLHQALGNRWSAIAARLPGRTDNEIKNVWNTHLKKRLKQSLQSESKFHHHHHEDFTLQELHDDTTITTIIRNSPPHSSSNDISSTITNRSTGTTTLLPNPWTNGSAMLDMDHHDFWCDNINPDIIHDSYSSGGDSGPGFMFTLSQGLLQAVDHHDCGFKSSSTQHDMDYWRDLFTITDDGISELLEF